MGNKMRLNRPKRVGQSYMMRVEAVNRIHKEHTREMPNREIWKRFVYPLYGITERTFYNYLKKVVI